MSSKAYRTPKSESEIEILINKSRFIGRCFPVCNEEEALSVLARVRRMHSDATHNCWAYNLRGGIMRFSDDGEPGGTAGMPIMDTLIRSDTQDSIIVVTRYFGGILLGSGGLTRAYSKSASEALARAGTVIMTPCNEIAFSVDYARYGVIEGFVRSNSTVKRLEFLENVRFNVLIKRELTDGFIADIIERTDGRVRPEVISETYMPCEV